MNGQYIQRSRSVAFRRLGQETIVMSSTDSTLFNLNEVATVIWESADGCTPLCEIVQSRICAEYEVEPETALRDAEEFVAQLAEHGLLLVSGQPLLPVAHLAGALR